MLGKLFKKKPKEDANQTLMKNPRLDTVKTPAAVTIEDALHILREHSAENIGEGIPEERILEIERKLGITFPNSYRIFLKEINYAELFNEEIYSIYDVPDDMFCLGVLQQNRNNELLPKGYLEIFSNDLDGTFYLGLQNGIVYLNSPDDIFANSFEEFIIKIIG